MALVAIVLTVSMFLLSAIMLAYGSIKTMFPKKDKKVVLSWESDMPVFYKRRGG
jgi:hypothetical protein